MKKQFIIVAGGSGSRINASQPKQFLEIGGKAILLHTLEHLYSFDQNAKLILVLPEKHLPIWNNILKAKQISIPHLIVKGGHTRFHSVKNGLKASEKSGIIAIHDGVRPFINHDFLSALFKRAEKKGNCIPVLPVDQSLRYINGEDQKRLDRQYYYTVQTPQCFIATQIHTAYEQDFHPRFTDDASTVESMGEKIYLTQGLKENIKITRPFDLRLAELMLENKE